MDGTTARAYRLIGSTRTPIGAAVTVNSSGTVVLPAIAVNGEYSIYFDYPTGLIDGYLESIDVEEQTFTGTAEEDATGLETYALTTIVGTVRTGGLAVNGAAIEADGSAGPSEFTTTDASGNYVVVVPAGATYDVFASKTGLVSDALTAVVAYVPKTGADLQLHYASFSTRVFEDDGLGNSTALPTTAHLYKMVAGGWQQVAFGATFGPSLWTNTSGNYRLRFSNGAAWVPIDFYELTDGAAVVPVPTLVDPDPSVCYIDFSPATAGAEYQVSVSTSDAPSVTCAAEPPVVVPPVKLGSTGSGAGSTDEAEPTATPTATPTPTPTPTAEPGDTDEGGTDEGVVEKPTTSSAPDLAWLFGLAGILALLILAGGAIYFVRRRT